MTEKQLWVVTDDANNWLWYGRGTRRDAIAGAKTAGAYEPEATLYLFAITGEIVIAPAKEG